MLALAGCGSHAIGPAPAGSPSTGDLPPKWVQQEALWQALAAGDAHPPSCRWLLVSAARAAPLAGGATAYLSGQPWSPGPVYVVVLAGHFLSDGGTKSRLDLLLGKRDHSLLAEGSTFLPSALARLGRLHVFTPRVPITSGLWGHAMIEGGPFPGSPRPLSQIVIDLWKGPPSNAPPIMTLRSDANGFFSIGVPPGTYTLNLASKNDGFAVPVTVRAKAGQPVAVLLAVQVP
jgi:hypothetical protein